MMRDRIGKRRAGVQEWRRPRKPSTPDLPRFTWWQRFKRWWNNP